MTQILKKCPVCHKMMFITGQDSKKRKLTSCGHSFSFNRTKSQKIMDRKYISTPWGLELKNEN